MAHDPAWAAIPTRQCRFDEAAPVAGVYMQAEQARKLQRLKAMKSARAVARSSGSGIDCVVRSRRQAGAVSLSPILSICRRNSSFIS